MKKQGVTTMECVWIVLISIILTSIMSIYIYKNVYTKTGLDNVSKDNVTNQTQETTNEIEKPKKTTYTFIAGENVQIISQNKNGTMKFYSVCPKCGERYFHTNMQETGIRSYNSSRSEWCWTGTQGSHSFNYSYYVQVNME